MVSLDLFVVFARVAETGSFSKAARDLGLSKATVSKRLAELEAALGVSLVARTTRRAALTEAGVRILGRAQRILEEAEAAHEEAAEARAAPRGRLRIAAPITFGVRYLAPILPDFLTAFPDISLDLRLSDKQVDLIGEGFDAAVRISAMEDSSLFGRRLSAVQTLVVASPAYWREHGKPQRPEDLARHPCFVYANSAGGPYWRFAKDGERVQVRPPDRVLHDNGDLIEPALRAGLGVALQPDFICCQDIEAGRLEAALTDWRGTELALHLLTPNARGAPRKVRAWSDFLYDRFGGERAPWRAACGVAAPG